ncbi:MAG: hypothetical protein KA603_01060 [Azonexus sp.]|jgi:hypothetical protein|nr:hypothetical protein [Betaproteobacteria bacterium]MBK8918775.1 hypothetical protein [Betaproteobacteria bacterium]MBP6034708.1 hypothetical protein [Azonexus sp.]MBP6905248.1 hypothetical protein [Azonexus sp.]
MKSLFALATAAILAFASLAAQAATPRAAESPDDAVTTAPGPAPHVKSSAQAKKNSPVRKASAAKRKAGRR